MFIYSTIARKRELASLSPLEKRLEKQDKDTQHPRNFSNTIHFPGSLNFTGYIVSKSVIDSHIFHNTSNWFKNSIVQLIIQVLVSDQSK